MRLHDYLQRLGVEMPLQADADTLRRLHVAHREAFLFENIAIQTGGSISVALDAIEQKFIDRGGGGYCFEHNTLFAAALRDVGFAPMTLLGRVRRGPPERWARTHMVLQVPIDGQSWLADVGFGGVGLLEPIPLRAGAAAEQAGLVYTLRREGALWILSMRDRVGSTMDMYEFSEDPQTSGDVEVANHYTSTHPDSMFRRTLTIQRSARDRRVILRGNTLTRHEDGRVIEETIGRDRVRDVARELFGVELPAGPLLADDVEAT
jgi:N-hydroxyarylamine O-acetyltransferase